MPRQIKAAKKADNILAFMTNVEIVAGKEDGSTAPRFNMVAYTGGELELPNFEMPVVVDLAGAKFHKSVKANLNHQRAEIVGHVDATTNDGKEIRLGGSISGGGRAAEEVLKAHKNGYPWEASIQANRLKLEILARGKTAVVNGQQVTGPKYIARESQIYAVAFCDQGADDSTTVTIAASAASNKETKMKAEVQAWAEGMGIDVANATPEAVATIEANYEGRHGKKASKPVAADPFEARKIEAGRRKEILAIADQQCDDYVRCGAVDQIDEIRELAAHAIENNMSTQDFRLSLYESKIPGARTVPASMRGERGLTGRILEAALCEVGNLQGIDKAGFTDQERQIAHDKFKGRISLNQFLIEAAQFNGYRGTVTGGVTPEIQNYAFGMTGGRQIHAAGGGFSMIEVSNIVAATANKFMMEGWMHVDLTPLRIAAIRNVKNFQQTTTVSLTGHLQFGLIGGDGELKHGTMADLTYTNQAATYGTLLSITRKDIINDDTGALTSAPKRLGRGGALKLNDIFWTEFLGLVSASFFASGNSNINTGVADMTVGGLDATETIFMNQTDPDSKPLGILPEIILVPTALKNKAQALMNPQAKLTSGSSTGLSDQDVFAGRFRLESSPYISNSSYTGYTSVAWWMLANPNVCPVIEIAALNGRVEPNVETADAAFNVLGIQMRGYSDIGVYRQEKRGGVHADGGAS